jgi:hypothetical protein
MKYLEIILDQKFRFHDHIIYAADKSSKLTHRSTNTAKLIWGIKYEAFATIYRDAFLPLQTYGSPVGSNEL